MNENVHHTKQQTYAGYYNHDGGTIHISNSARPTPLFEFVTFLNKTYCSVFTIIQIPCSEYIVAELCAITLFVCNVYGPKRCFAHIHGNSLDHADGDAG